MTEDQDRPADLELLRVELEWRSSRMAGLVLARVRDRHEQVEQPGYLREGVRRRLAGFAWPATLAAALSFLAILATRSSAPEPRPAVFAVMVMGQTPVARWIALGQPPEIAELLQAMEGR